MATNLMTEPWFHGSISRQEAEELLLKAGKTDGLFLVRESVTQVGSFALSMCFNNRIIHYHAQRQPDGFVAIEDGPKFPGPVELVHYHSLQLDGLLCKLLKPCLRPHGVRPKTFSGVHQKHIKDAAEKALESMGVENDTAMQRQMESFIGKVLHQSELWFHGNISREEAERRLQRCGCTNGLFLIRERKAPPGTFAMGLCYNGSVVHYLFDVDATGQLSIQSGPKFENLMLAIDHYTLHNDGLLYNLKEPCDASLFESRRRTLPRPEFQFPGRPASRSFGENDTTPRSP
ncbi:Tyrosine-protein kinase SYK, partial [Exaiptasia diaphana]